MEVLERKLRIVELGPKDGIAGSSGSPAVTRSLVREEENGKA